MVIDSSALVAILLQEPESDRFMQTAVATPLCLVSAASYLETCMVMIGRSGPLARFQVDRLVQAIGAEIVPFTESQSRRAVDAFLRYGKGRQRGAGLNFGDCCSYALAVETGLPLLFKGDDFGRTDVTVA
ncbi:MAG: type II toxin-antitoxin system VapC family toxin [Acetobacteraceae bacterium]|jgi:ribonuclease VapC